MTKREELIWCAGVLEGEGCFRVKRGSRAGYRPALTVNIGSTDADVIDRVSAAFPAHGKITTRRKEPHKPMFVVEWFGEAAEALMRTIAPFMGERRKAKIEECLSTPDLSHTQKKQQASRIAATRKRQNGKFI